MRMLRQGALYVGIKMDDACMHAIMQFLFSGTPDQWDFRRRNFLEKPMHAGNGSPLSPPAGAE